MPKFIENIIIGIRVWVLAMIKYLRETKEDNSNKVTSISNSSTDAQYPSAKCIYDEFEGNVESESLSQNGVTISDFSITIGETEYNIGNS